MAGLFDDLPDAVPQQGALTPRAPAGGLFDDLPDAVPEQSTLGVAGRNVVSRLIDLAAGIPTGIGAAVDPVAKALESVVPLGGLRLTNDGVSYLPPGSEYDQNPLGRSSQQAAALAKDAIGYDPQAGTSFDDVKADPLRNVVPFIAEQGPASLVDAAGAVANFPAYLFGRVGSMAQDRAEADNREIAGAADVTTVAPAAGVSAALERIGGKGLIPGPDDVGGMAGRIAKAAGKEAATEAVDETAETVATRAGTATGLTMQDVLDGAMSGALVGGAAGGAARGAMELVLSRRKGRTPADITMAELAQDAQAGDISAQQYLQSLGLSARQVAALDEQYAAKLAEAARGGDVEGAKQAAAAADAFELARRKQEAGVYREDRYDRSRDPETNRPMTDAAGKPIPAETIPTGSRVVEVTGARPQRVRPDSPVVGTAQAPVSKGEGIYSPPAIIPDQAPAPTNAMTPRQIVQAQRVRATQEPEAAPGPVEPGEAPRAAEAPPRLVVPEGRAPQTPDQVQQDRQAGGAFTLAGRQRQRAGETVRDTRPGGRPEGGLESQQRVVLDEGRPVQVVREFSQPTADGKAEMVAEVYQYDPRTGEPAETNEDGTPRTYMVEKKRLDAADYAVEPRRAQEFEDAAQAPRVNKGKAKGRRADDLQGLPRQTYRTTEPDPTLGSEGPAFDPNTRGPDTRAPRPDQGDGPGFDQQSGPGGRRGPYARGPYTTAEEAWRDFEARAREREEAGFQQEQARAEQRYKDAKSSNRARPWNQDGALDVDEDGFVLSDKDGPVIFADQKQAAKWIMKQQKDAANTSGQFYEIANHPTKAGRFTVRERGRAGGQRSEQGPQEEQPQQQETRQQPPRDDGPQRALPGPASNENSSAEPRVETAAEPDVRPASNENSPAPVTLDDYTPPRLQRPLQRVRERQGGFLAEVETKMNELAAVIRSQGFDPRTLPDSAPEHVRQAKRRLERLAKMTGDYVGVENLTIGGSKFGNKSRAQKIRREIRGEIERPVPEKAQPRRQARADQFYPKPERPAGRNQSLLEFIAARGGVSDPGGDVRAIVGTKDAKATVIPGVGNWVRSGAPVGQTTMFGNSKENSLDYMREAAVEAGYLPEGAETRDLLDAIAKEYAGEKVTPVHGGEGDIAMETQQGREGYERDAALRRAAREMDAYLEAEGLTDQVDDDAYRVAVDLVADGRDPDTALDEAADFLEREAMQREDEPSSQQRAFDRWFEGSKVVDQEGRPLPVYHGTDAGDFRSFKVGAWFSEDPDEAGAYSFASNVRKADAARGKFTVRSGADLSGQAFEYYGTISDIDAPATGAVYATDQGVFRYDGRGKWTVFDDLVLDYDSADSDTVEVQRGDASHVRESVVQEYEDAVSRAYKGGEGGRVYKVFLSIKNPVQMSPFEANRIANRLGMGDKEIQAVIADLEAQGYDGIVTFSDEATAFVANGRSVPRQWVAFKPEQVKAAHNKGPFDPKSKDILEDDGGLSATFYSNPFADPELLNRLLVQPAIEAVRRFSKKAQGAKVEVREAVGNMGAMWDRIFSTHDTMMRRANARGPKSQTAERIMDMLYQRAGRTEFATEGETLPEATNSRMNRNVLRYAEAVEGLDHNEKAKVADAVRQGSTGALSPKLANAAKALREQLDDILAYMKEAGVKIEGVKRNYFPREYDPEMVEAKRGEFIQRAADEYQRAARKQGRQMPRAEAEIKADELANAIVHGDMAKFNASRGDVAANFFHHREFGEAADTTLADFMIKDTDYLMLRYTQRAVRRAELARRFGDRFENWERDFGKPLREEGASDIAPALQEQILASVGIHGRGTGSKALSWVHAWMTMGLLEQATITSLSEAAMPMLRAPSVKAALGNLVSMTTDTARFLARRPRGQRGAAARELAEWVGAVAAEGHMSLMIARFHGSEVGSRKQAHALGNYFRAIGLDQFTNYTRSMAVQNGADFLVRMAKALDGKSALLSPKEARNMLAELGIPRAKIDATAKWLRETPDPLAPAARRKSPAEAEVVRQALFRFAEQAIMRPDAMTKPQWASHPIGRVFFALQSYGYTFAKQVLARQVQLVKRGGAAALDGRPVDAAMLIGQVALTASVLPLLQYAISSMRDDLDEELTGKERRMTWTAEIERAISRSGLLGAADPYLQLIASTRYNQSAAKAVAGPVFGGPIDAVDAFRGLGFNNSAETNSAERRAASAVYTMGIEPGLNMIMARANLIGAGFLVAQAARYGKDRFVDKVAGEKKPSKRDYLPREGIIDTVTGYEPPDRLPVADRVDLKRRQREYERANR